MELEAWLAMQKPARMLELGLIARPKILLADGRARRDFLTDVCELARDFASIVKAASVEVHLKVVTEKGFQAEAVACTGVRMLTVYRVSSVRHLRHAKCAPTSDWQLSNGGTLLQLGPASVVMLRHRPTGTGADRNAVRPSASMTDFRSSRLFYMLEIRP
jgi:hypothetical protein